jgi:Zn-finger nucleic acid-binding protein
MSERRGVEIDYCPDCRGVWLDRGELDKLVDRADDDDGDSRAGRDDREWKRPVRKKKSSFLKDFFEFGED